MSDRNNIQDELKGMESNLPVDGGPAPFSVPDGYFDGLAATILAKAKAQDADAAEELAVLSPLLASVPRTMPYNLPEGYFEENLSALPFFSEEKESPVLNSVGKALPYTVPQGYFENLPRQILEKLPKREGKVVPLFARNWMRAAVAAVVGGFIFISGYRYFNNKGDAQTALEQPVDTTKNWTAKNDQAVMQDLKNVSPKELDEFMSTMPLKPAETRESSSVSVNKGEVKKLLKDVSAKEIENFLEQLPSVDEDLAIIN